MSNQRNLEIKFSQVFMLIIFSQFFSVTIFITFVPIVQNWPELPTIDITNMLFGSVFVGFISLILASPSIVVGSFVSKYMIEQRIVDPILWVAAAVASGALGSIYLWDFLSGFNLICAPMIGLMMCFFARRFIAENNKDDVDAFKR